MPRLLHFSQALLYSLLFLLVSLPKIIAPAVAGPGPGYVAYRTRSTNYMLSVEPGFFGNIAEWKTKPWNWRFRPTRSFNSSTSVVTRIIVVSTSEIIAVTTLGTAAAADAQIYPVSSTEEMSLRRATSIGSSTSEESTAENTSSPEPDKRKRDITQRCVYNGQLRFSNSQEIQEGELHIAAGADWDGLGHSELRDSQPRGLEDLSGDIPNTPASNIRLGRSLTQESGSNMKRRHLSEGTDQTGGSDSESYSFVSDTQKMHAGPSTTGSNTNERRVAAEEGGESTPTATTKDQSTTFSHYDFAPTDPVGKVAFEAAANVGFLAVGIGIVALVAVSLMTCRHIFLYPYRKLQDIRLRRLKRLNKAAAAANNSNAPAPMTDNPVPALVNFYGARRQWLSRTTATTTTTTATDDSYSSYQESSVNETTDGDLTFVSGSQVGTLGRNATEGVGRASIGSSQRMRRSFRRTTGTSLGTTAENRRDMGGSVGSVGMTGIKELFDAPSPVSS